MKLQGSTLLALRFLRSSTQEKTINIMLKVCFISIIIATFALTLVAAIMNGFEKATYEKLKGVHADITLSAHDKPLNYGKIKTVLDKEFKNSIQAYSPTSHFQVMIQNNNSAGNNSQICLLKVIDPEKEPLVSKLGDALEINQRSSEAKTVKTNVWHSLNHETIFIGTALAERLAVKEGSQVTLLYPEDEIVNNKVLLQTARVTIGALFKTGITDFDEHVIVGSFALAEKLFQQDEAPSKKNAINNVTQITIKLKDPDAEESTLKALKDRLKLEATSWKELYPPLISALMLEKYAMLFILALVTLIASMTIISLLFMYVTQKKLNIALLKIMGMSDYHVIRIFVLISLFLTGTATLIGIFLATIVVWILNKYPFITLPDVYYVSHLPALLDLRIIISVLLFALFIAIFAALLPTRSIRFMRVSDVLKGIIS